MKLYLILTIFTSFSIFAKLNNLKLWEHAIATVNLTQKKSITKSFQMQAINTK